MTKKIFKQEDGFGLRLVGRLVIFLTVISFLGCVAAIPAVVIYEREHEYIVTVQLPKNADKVYQTALEVSQEMSKEGELKIVKKDDKKRLIYAESTSQPPRKGTFEVRPVDAKSCQVIAIGVHGKYEKEDKKVMFEALKRLAEKLGVEYKLVKVVR